MNTERIGTDRNTIECSSCGNIDFEIPHDRSHDPIVTCACGHVVGPYWSLAAMSVGEAPSGCRARVRPFHRTRMEYVAA